MREVSQGEQLPQKVYKIEMLDGKIVDFSDSKQGYAYLNGKEIICVNKDSTDERYSTAYVKKYYTKKFDPLKSVGLVVLTVVGISLIFVTMFFIELDGRGLGG